VEYNVRNISLFRVLEVLLIMPSTDIADTELYCLLHFISSVLNQFRDLFLVHKTDPDGLLYTSSRVDAEVLRWHVLHCAII